MTLITLKSVQKLALSIGIGILLTSCGSAEEKTTNLNSVLDKQVKEVNSTTENLSKKTEEKKEMVSEEVKNLEEHAADSKESLEESMEDTKEIVSENVDELKKETESVSNAIEKTIAEANETLTNTTSEVKEETTETVEEEVVKIEEKVVVPFSHAKFDALLRKNVTSSGKVNYNGFKGNASFEEYLKELSSNEPASSWSRNKKLAYWINAYNAFTIKLILDNYPVSSITKLKGGKPWDYSFIKIGSKTYSLNHIEHKIIRPTFKEPRIHFACVCAAKSCPKLANKAYTASNLNSLLTTQTKYFINNKSKNQIADKNLKVSSLFDWYAEDFGDVNAYIAKYYNGTFKEDKEIEFMDYDWSLNN